VTDAVTTCQTGTQLRVYSAAGGQLGYSQSENLALGVSVTNPVALFSGVSRAVAQPLLAAVSDSRFDVSSSTNDNQRGVELVGVYLAPAADVQEVSYVYGGGDLAAEASNWLAAAASIYTNDTPVMQVEELGIGDTLVGMLVERKVADLLYSRAVITNAWCSLFAGRSADGDMSGLSSADVLGLESAGANGEDAYLLSTLVSNIEASASSAANLQLLTRDIYDICCVQGCRTDNLGKYPLPADVLRGFLYSGNLQSNYLAASSLTALQIESAYTEATQLLAQVSSRPMVHLTLETATNSFSGSCPVLYPVGGGTGKSLYDSAGHPYRFPSTFDLQAGAQVTLDAYSDVSWDLCPGSDPLEVVALELTAVPTATGSDADGNLLPDDYEAIFLADSNGTATNDMDGDGFSDLQEYLDQTDPANSASHGTTPVSMEPPVVSLTSQSGSTFSFQVDWPAAYASDFVFVLEYSDELGETPFVSQQALPQGSLSTTIDGNGIKLRFYRAKMQLR
jgi:hypothetical protein